MGANLLKGLRGSGVQKSVIFGIIAARYIALPLISIFIVRGALRFGFIPLDPLHQFILLLQFAVPPAMNMGTEQFAVVKAPTYERSKGDWYHHSAVWRRRDWMFGYHTLGLCLGFNFTHSLVNLLYVAGGLIALA